jgi:cysteine desulfurase
MILWYRQVYMDHNATTPVAPEVRRAMAKVLESAHGNPSSLHTQGREARGLMDTARRQVAELLGAKPEQLFFTSGGTEASNTVIKGVFGMAGKGHVVTTLIEHDCVLGACRQVEELGGTVTRVAAGPDGRVRLEDIRAALRPDTVLVSVMHANNETGAIQPVAEIAALAHERGIPFHTDAVQSVGKIPVSVTELGCDFLTCSSHKINGPKGCGVIYWRGQVPWRPLIFGGDQESHLRGGTEAVHQIVGFGVAAELARKRLAAGERARLAVLRERLLTGIRRLVPEIRVHESAPEHQLSGTLNLMFPGCEGIRLLAGLDCHGVAVSIGSACTADRIEPSHVLLGMGVSAAEALSSIRVSMGSTTMARDVDYFLKALQEVLKGDPHGFAYLDPQHLTEARIKSPETFLIDLRFPYERMLAAGIPGAKEWSHIGFERYFRQIPKDREIIMICATGILSMSAGYRLAAHGHPRVRVVYGGYNAWKPLHPGLLERLNGK